jgi:hypothetical protein
MMQVEQLQIEIEALPPTEFIRLRKWFAEMDWIRWDRQLETDIAAGSGSAIMTSMTGLSVEDLYPCHDKNWIQRIQPCHL